MLWLKLVLGYCVLVVTGMWLGYRSRKSGPSSRDADRSSRLEVAGGEDPVEPGAGSATGLR
jgi:hypothetical protein